MSPETINFMAIAEGFLDRAERNFLAEIYEDVIKNAYMSALNATRAVIFDKTGVAPKTHSGARAKFHQLVHEGIEFDDSLLGFLSSGFNAKQGIDYGPDLFFVNREEAIVYLDRAAAFLAAAKKVCE